MHRERVAVIRAEALNPFEMQSYVPLREQYEIRLIGRRRAPYETALVDLPCVLLPSIGSYSLLRKIWRGTERTLRTQFRDTDFLVGLGSAVADCEILHAAETAIPVSEQVATICKRTDQKLVLTCWETIPFRYDDDARLRSRKCRVKDAVSLYIAVTPQARDALVDEGVDASQIEVVPAAVDCRRFSPDVYPGGIRSQWKITESQTVVLYVGRLIQEKGIVELVRAFSRVRDRDSVLVIVGYGNQKDRAMHAARSLGITERVRVVSRVSYADVPRLYAAADVVVAPSLPTPYWEEQFGMVLVEAMASGRALLTTASGAIPGVVKEAAVQVSPYCADSLAEQLQHLVSSPDVRSELGSRARQLALSSYSLEVVAPQLAACYKRVLTG